MIGIGTLGNVVEYNNDNPFGNASGIPNKEEYDSEEKWRLACYHNLSRGSVGSARKKQALYEAAYQVYLATTDSAGIPDYATVQDSDGVATSSMPYEYFNPLFAPVRKRVGEFKQMGLRPTVRITNDSAKSRKEKEKINAIISKALGEAQNFAESVIGQPMPNPVAQAEQMGFNDFQEYLQRGYRDLYEIEAERILTDWLDKNHFKLTLDQIYHKFVLTQTAILFPTINPFSLEVELQIEDPVYCLWDMNGTDEYGRDIQWFTRYRYESDNEILRRYPDISREQLEDIGNNSIPNHYTYITGLFPPVYSEGDENYYLVSETRWIYTEDTSLGQAIDNTDIELTRLDPVMADEAIPYEEVYYTVRIGHHFEAVGGRLPFQARSVDVTEKANLGVFVLNLDHAISPAAPTNIARVQSYISLRNMLMYKASSLIADMKGVILEVDLSMVPIGEDGNPDTKGFMEAMQSNKIVFKDTTEAAMSMGEPSVSLRYQDAINVKEVGMPKDLGNIMNMINIVTNQINELLGINEAAIGQVGQYQNATTAKINEGAYKAALAYEDKSFLNITEIALTHIANLKKILGEYKKIQSQTFTNYEAEDAINIRVGDTAVSMDPEGFLFQDIGAHIKLDENTAAKRQMFIQAAQMSLQQGSMTFREYLELMESDTTTEMIERMKAYYAAQEQQAQAQQQQQMQMQQQMMQQQMQQQAQMQQLDQQQKTMSEMQIQTLKKDLEERNAAANSTRNAQMQAQAKQSDMQEKLAEIELEASLNNQNS